LKQRNEFFASRYISTSVRSLFIIVCVSLLVLSIIVCVCVRLAATLLP